MAKTWFDEKAWRLRNLEHARRTEAYVLTMRKVLDAFGAEMSNATLLTDFNPDDGKPLSFANYPVTKAALGRAVKDYSASVAMLIQRGTGDEWRRSDELVSQWAEGVIKMYSKSSKNGRGDIETSEYFRDNTEALRAFQNRVEKGMHLSDKVWALAKDTTKELEAAIGTAIERGASAVTLSKRVSKYLIDFDGLKKDYKSKYGTAADIKNCEYRAARLARTEINMAYRQAENERWQQMDFVLGYRVRLSGAHPFVDMCNALQGDYPKTFKFSGWHPNCYCYAIPILQSEEGFFSFDESKKEKPITELPKGFTDWERKQEDSGRVGEAAQRGTLPYFLRDNGHVEKGRWVSSIKPIDARAKKASSITEVARERHAKRTQEQIDHIKAKWSLRKTLGNMEEVIEKMKERSVDFNEVKYLPKAESITEIISTLAGGDLTDGSCSSLAVAFAGRRAGFDVLDFRGGASQKTLSSTSMIASLVKNAGGKIVEEYSDFKGAEVLLKDVEQGKYYYFACGRHAAIVRKGEKGLEYLEMQDAELNGFKPLDKSVLKDRFGAKQSHTVHRLKHKSKTFLADIEHLSMTQGFKRLLGYINTAEGKQMKGSYGTIK